MMSSDTARCCWTQLDDIGCCWKWRDGGTEGSRRLLRQQICDAVANLPDCKLLCIYRYKEREIYFEYMV